MSKHVIGLVVATEIEARPFRQRFFRGDMAWEAAGRHWLSGEVGKARHGHRSVMVVSGYDKANTAAATESLIDRSKPELVINFGIAGAFPGSGLSLRDVVLADRDSYADTGSSSPGGWLPAEEFGIPLARVAGREYWNTFPLSARHLRGAEKAVRQLTEGQEPEARFRLLVGPCLTSSLVTGTEEEARSLEQRWAALAESMEGAACAHICLLHGVPCLEVRAISNMVGDRDRASWDIRGAAERASEAAAALCDNLPQLTEV